VIEFHPLSRSGVAPYVQLIQQVRGALRLGLLEEGDQLPTVKEVSIALAINPNTVLKAYRELEYEGVVAGRQGVGTFITKPASEESVAVHQELGQDLLAWVQKARAAGLDTDSIEDIFRRVIGPRILEEQGV